jgi:hypothetical protein
LAVDFPFGDETAENLAEDLGGESLELRGDALLQISRWERLFSESVENF